MQYLPQNSRKSNPKMYRKSYKPQASGIYSRYAMLGAVGIQN